MGTPRRVLVVDDQEVNLRLFEARLVGHGFEVVLAKSAFEALELLEAAQDEALPHLILLDVMMPGMNGFELLDRLKTDPRLGYLPVLMLTALSGSDDRAKAFALGADDFLSKPVNAAELLLRVRNLTDLGRLRHSGAAARPEVAGELLVFADASSTAALQAQLQPAGYRLRSVSSGAEVLSAVASALPDLALLGWTTDQRAVLELCRELKAEPRSAHVPVVLLAEREQHDRRVQGWEVDADDILFVPFDSYELLARVRSLVRRKRRHDEVLENYDQLLQRTITDSLTGVYNRAYLDEVIRREIALCRRSGRPLSFLMLDLDHFKAINDTYGHGVGDEVLKRFAALLRAELRVSDVVARYGGEEFAIVLSDSPRDEARRVAERILKGMAARRWDDLGLSRPVTVSIGVASFPESAGGEEALVRLADEALYRAKREGRNRVIVA